MAQDGDSILRSLQNNQLPILDIVVRESIQNSLDAALPDSSQVQVDFFHGSFNNHFLANLLEEVGPELKNRYGEEEKYLAFSDKNTSGLTGTYNSNDSEENRNSNFQKLIFGIGKNQEQEGAGGSWGLGKTSYFRIGNGLVFYYTRIFEEGRYEERLIASLIESPKEPGRLLKENDRGIAWWGEYDVTGEKILPITNHETIKSILDIFSLETYQEDETGTMIIIPYLNQSEIFKKSEDEKEYYWDNDIESQLKLAVKRWYSPRLMNHIYRGKFQQAFLVSRVNGSPVFLENNGTPVFNIFKVLYNAALTGENLNKNYSITISEIKFPRMITEESKATAGRVAFTQVNQEQLGMGPPNNDPHPLAFLGIKDNSKLEKLNSKVLAYARKPGMIVKYSVDDDWTPKADIVKDDHILLAFFVPVSDVRLHKKHQEKGFMNMEQYLRAIENADHALWEDRDGFNIVDRTKRVTSQLILDKYDDQETKKSGSATSGLARKYGALFVPLQQGNRGSRPKQTNPATSRTSHSRASLSIEDILFNENKTVSVDTSIFLPANSRATISLKIKSTDNVITKSNWERSFEGKLAFPIKINDFIAPENIHIKEITDDQIIFHTNEVDSVLFQASVNLNIDTVDYSPLLSISSVETKTEEAN